MKDETFQTGEADHPRAGDLIIMQCVRHDPPWCDLKMLRVDGPVYQAKHDPTDDFRTQEMIKALVDLGWLVEVGEEPA
jgi:hypothetical protein